MYKKQNKTKIKDDVKLFVGNFITNVKGIVKRDKTLNLKKFHSQAKEISICKEYQL